MAVSKKKLFEIFLSPENAGLKTVGLFLGIIFNPGSLFLLIDALWRGRFSTALFHEFPYWINLFFLMILFINVLIGIYFANAFGESIKHEGTGMAIWNGVAGGTAIGFITGATIGIFPGIADFHFHDLSDTILPAITYSIIGLLIGAFIGLIIALLTALLWHLMSGVAP